MKKLLLSSFIFLGVFSYAQEQIESEAPVAEKHWTTKGNITLLLNQSSFKNWTAGGENNLSANLGINYDFNYKKDNWTWDNKIIAEYGIVKTQNTDFEKKTNDRLELNSLIGKKTEGYWYYSAFLNFKTQFTNGYIYGTNNGKQIRTENTGFMSPGYLNLGLGMLWKKSDNLKVNVAPVTSKITFVDGKFTSKPEYVNGTYFGLDKNKNVRYELGFNAAAYYKFNAMKNVSVENTLTLYSNYLQKPQNVDIDYTLNVVMTINKYLSTNLIFQTIYDDDAFKGFQTRQVFGLGINYGF